MQPVRRGRPLRRLLFVAPNWLGDVVMATHLLDWLAAARSVPGGPRFTLSVAIREAWAPLFTGDRRIDELVLTARPGRHAGVGGPWRQARQWRGLAADAVLLGPPSLRAAMVAAAAGIPRRFGHAGDARSVLLTRALRRCDRGARHYSQELIDLGRALAVDCGWPADAMRAAEAAPATGLRRGRAPTVATSGRPLWALGAGTTFGPAKTWPTGPAASFLAAAVERTGARMIVLGDGGATPLAAALREATPGLRWAHGEAAAASDAQADVIDLTGATDLAGVVHWLGSCAVYVGNDSGLMHLAAALGTPTVGLFGSSNPDWTRPLGPRVATLAADGFACRPCYRRTCNQARFCLADVSGERVLAATLELLGGGTVGRGSPGAGGTR